MNGIRDEDKDALLILDCVTHDRQGFFKELPSAGAFSSGGEIFRHQYQNDQYQNHQYSNQINQMNQNQIEIEESDEEPAALDSREAQEYDLAAYAETHRLFLFDEKLDKKLKYDEMDVYLSAEQSTLIQEYLTNQQPSLILGGAGTGKTIVALHILHDYQYGNPGARCIYFTHSQELLRKAEAKYRSISRGVFGEESRLDGREQTEFWDIGEYCISRLKCRRTDRAGYERFSRFVKRDKKTMNQLSKFGISIYDLWAEIQGTIKGGLDQDWCRAGWTDWREQEYTDQVMSELRKWHLIEENEDDTHLFCLKKDVYTMVKEGNASLSDKTMDIIHKLCKKLPFVDAKMPMQRKDIYLKLPEENTTLEALARQYLYAFCSNQYMRWLKEHGYYDDNDLACRMLDKNDGSAQEYDLIVIDEIQDYTELQIYLITKMARHAKGIVMAGDSHQIVNPTMFREQRIRQLFQQKLSVSRLEKNFRSQEKIVEYANAVASMRRKKIGSTKSESETAQGAVFSGSCPVKMLYTEHNMLCLMDKLLDYPGAVILTATESDKQRMIQLYGEEHYAQKKNRILFTVNEIKGMEYKAVFCLNLVGSFHEAWKQIFSGEARRKTKYRYYFNLLYTGVSRAQDYLCIIEENPDREFDDFMNRELPYQMQEVRVFDESSLHLEDLDNSEEEWRIQAERYKKQGKYKEAADSLRKAGAGEEEIMECRMYQCIQENDYTKMMEYALCLERREEAERYYEELDQTGGLAKLVCLWLTPDKAVQNRLFSPETLAGSIAECFPDMDSAWTETIQIMYLRILREYMQNQVKRLQGDGL